MVWVDGTIRFDVASDDLGKFLAFSANALGMPDMDNSEGGAIN